MEQSHKIKKKGIKCLTFWMIPHIIQERSVEQDIHHTGEAAPRTPIHGGEEPRRRTSSLWLQSKTCIPPPRGGEKAKLLHQWRLQTWTSVCPRRGCPCKSTLGPLQPPPPRALPNLSFSLFFFLFFLNCCCFGSMDSTYISHFFVSEFEFCFLSASISPLTGSPHVDTLLYESDVCLFFFSSCRYALLKCVKQPIHFIWKYKRIKTSDSFEKHKYELTVMHYFDCLQNKQNNTYNYSNN